jgi:hypothetical protein
MRHTRKRGGGLFDLFKNKPLKNKFTWKKKVLGPLEPNFFRRGSSPTGNFNSNQELKRFLAAQDPTYRYYPYQLPNKVEPVVPQPNLTGPMPANNSYLNNAFGQRQTAKASDYTVVGSNNNNSNILGLGILNEHEKKTGNINYDDRDYLRSLDQLTLDKLMFRGLIKREPIQRTINRVFVMLYLKYKKSPLLTNDSIVTSYTIKNNPDFPLELTHEQLNELRRVVKDYIEAHPTDNYDILIDNLSNDIFNTPINNMREDIHNWEKPGIFIYRGNKCFTVMQGDTTLNRTIQTLLLSDLEHKYKLEISSYTCLPPNPIYEPDPSQRCIHIFNSIYEYNPRKSLYDDSIAFEYIVIKNFNSGGMYDFKKFNEFTFLQKLISEGKLILIHPHLGFIIQKMYPEVWASSYWFPSNIDSITKIVLLTLQKYSALRRYDATGDDSWSSYLYKQNPFEPSTAYELKNPQIILGNYEFNEAEFLEELIVNQIWAVSLNEDDFKRRKAYYNSKKASGNTYGIPYKTLKDLDRLLPTPPGFKPKFFWQVYDSKNKDKPKTAMRHKNILYHISTVKHNTNREGAKIARKMGNTWRNIERMKGAPQYATQESIDSYYRNFNSGDSFLPPGLTNVQRRARPKRGVNNAPREVFQPITVRRTRKTRR